MKRSFLLPVPAIALFAAAAAAAPSIAPTEYARINAALVETHVLPRYARLAGATGALASAAAHFCREGTADPVRLRESFHDAMRGWTGIRHIRFGPVEYFSRAQRFHLWPQARGKTARAIDAALAGDDAALRPVRFEKTTAAVQGFAAAERLIFDERYLGGDRTGCRLLLAVTANMRRMAAGIVADWTGGALPFLPIVTQPGPDNGYFGDHREATLALFRSLHDGLQYVVDVALKPVVGASPETARPGFAESRPSGRSTRNVIAGLAALQALYRGEGGPGLGALTAAVDPKLDRLMRKAFRATLKTARSIAVPLERAVTDPVLRPKASKLLLQSRALKQIVRDRLATALGLAIGFNALDGD